MRILVNKGGEKVNDDRWNKEVNSKWREDRWLV